MFIRIKCSTRNAGAGGGVKLGGGPADEVRENVEPDLTKAEKGHK